MSNQVHSAARGQPGAGLLFEIMVCVYFGRGILIPSARSAADITVICGLVWQ